MDVFRQALSVLLVFALLGTLLWALRRNGRISFNGFGQARKPTPGREKAMVRVERLSLTPQHTLHIVRINGEEVLVATHPQGCSVVTNLAKARAVGAEA